MTRYLSLWMPFLPLDRLRREEARARSHRTAARADVPSPCATVATSGNMQRLAAVDAIARQAGLRPGLPLADARARVPTLATDPADPAADARALEGIAAWCRRFTPLAAPDAPDGVVLDITGVSHLFGGEAALRQETVTRLATQGFAAEAAVADTPEAAWALARFGSCRTLPAGATPPEVARAVAALPLDALRLEADIVAALAGAGLRSLRDIALRPRAPIAARFGSMVYRRYDALIGLCHSPISPKFEAPAYLAERRFADGLLRIEDIEQTVRGLADEIAALLARHGEGARRLAVSLFRLDGAVKVVEAGTSRPVRDPAALARLFHERFEALGEDGLDSGYGFDLVRLAVLAAERLDAVQPRWDAAGDDPTAFADLLDRLGARLGPRRVLRFVPVDAHLPERATSAVPAATYGTATVARAVVAVAPCFEAEPMLPARPVRLFDPPEPIETVAGLPDDPPRRFTWRRVSHEVVAIEGPERIAPEWWHGSTSVATRDYFRAEDASGLRFWLFREGLYAPENPLPRWYVHGLFS